MSFLDLIAEQKIAAAVARGELAGLPGEGRPLDLEDDAHVPEDMRVAYRILKNAGFVPPELENLREIGALEALIESQVDMDPEARSRALRKLHLLRIAREEARGLRERYSAKILARLAR